MDRFLQDVRFALRSLSRQPGLALAAVVTLGLGIGATTATFSVVNGVLLRSLPYPEPTSLVRLWQTNRRSPSGPTDGSVSPVVFDDWRERTTSFESMASWARSQPTITGLGDAEVVTGALVTADFFRVFRSEPALGRGFSPEETLTGGPLAVIVSWGFWQERLGGGTFEIGRTIELNGRPWEIVGVAPPGFDYPGTARVWQPLRNIPRACDRTCVFLNTVARLAPGTSLTRARQEMASVSDILSAEFPEALTNFSAAMESLQATMVGDVGRALWLLLGAVGLVLLVACANVANLMIARGTARADEIAVRAALGAGRRRIVLQLLTESLILAVAGGSAGLLLSGVGVRALRVLSADGIPRIDEVGIDGRVMLFALAAAFGTALLSGLVPALQLARGSVAGTLRQSAGRTTGGRRGFGRSALLATEVGFSLLLLVGAGLLVRSFASMQRIDPGFTAEGVSLFAISLPGPSYPSPERVSAFLDEVQDRLRAIPGVTDVGRSLYAPLSGGEIVSNFLRPDLPAPEPGSVPGASLYNVDDRFFDVLGVRVEAGRSFSQADRQGSEPVIIINRALARQYFPGEDPLGRSIAITVAMGFAETESRRIVGIVGDVKAESLIGEPGPGMYVPFAQSAPGYATFLLRSGLPFDALAPRFRDIVRSLDANLAIRSAGTMTELVSRQTARARFYLFLLALFAVLSLVLASVGLYGVVAYLVAQRRREIGIRMVLGANSASVVRLVVRQGLEPALLGAAAGLGVALAGARVLDSLLFEVKPLDPITFAGTTGLLIAVVVVACMVPAVRASRIAPATALRQDR